MQKSLFTVLSTIITSTIIALTGCGQNPQNQHTTNPQYQTQNQQANPNIDCTPITNPNYVPGGNQAQYYYPEGCQPPINNGYPNNGYTNNGYNNGSNIGGYVGAAAVGAAAGALANRAYNRNNQAATAGNTNNGRIVVPPINRSATPANNRTYTPATTSNSSVYRPSSSNNRATATSRGRRR